MYISIGNVPRYLMLRPSERFQVSITKSGNKKVEGYFSTLSSPLQLVLRSLDPWSDFQSLILPFIYDRFLYLFYYTFRLFFLSLSPINEKNRYCHLWSTFRSVWRPDCCSSTSLSAGCLYRIIHLCLAPEQRSLWNWVSFWQRL